MRALAKRLPPLTMRSAPIPLIWPLKSEFDTSRKSVVPRGGMSSTLTLCAPTLAAVLVPPVGKNPTNALALWSVPIVELLKMLRSVWKCVPFAPDAEPATGMKTSFAADSAPATARLGNIGVLSVSVNEQGFASNCCATALLIIVEPTKGPLLAVWVIRKITLRTAPAVRMRVHKLVQVPQGVGGDE